MGLEVLEGILDRPFIRHEAAFGRVEQLQQRLFGRARELQGVVAIEFQIGALRSHLALGPRPRFQHDHEA